MCQINLNILYTLYALHNLTDFLILMCAPKTRLDNYMEAGRWGNPPSRGRKLARVYMQTYNPGVPGDVTQRYCVVARHVNRENGRPTTYFDGQCFFLLLSALAATFQCCGFLLSLLMIQSLRQRQLTLTWTRPRLGGLPHLKSFTWQNATPTDRVTLPGRPGDPPRRATQPFM